MILAGSQGPQLNVPGIVVIVVLATMLLAEPPPKTAQVVQGGVKKTKCHCSPSLNKIDFIDPCEKISRRLHF